jgi:excisionase family DNA binding protein
MQFDLTTTPKLAYSIPQAVEATSVGRSTLYGQIKEGHLKATRIGGRTVIMADELMRWLNSFSETDE